MEKIHIKTNEFDAEMVIDNDKIFGYKFYKDNNVETIDESISEYFIPFLCSKNRIKLDAHSDYDVYLDNDTMFKHYFKNGVEDFKMFFKNNGESIVCYSGNGERDGLKKFEVIFDRFNCMIIASSVSLGFVINCLSAGVITKKIDKNYARDFFLPQSNQIEYSDVVSKIYSSSNLSEEEKRFLCNKDFIEDMLKYKNDSRYLKYIMNKRLTEMEIRSFGIDDESYDTSSGYYDSKEENVLFIADYEGLNSYNADTVAHENVHLWQDVSGYNLLIESTAEILSHEYFNTPLNSYKKQIKLTCMLMEIIGSEPILNYVITGDFRDIENRVKPYLNEGEYKSFLNSMSFDREKDNTSKYNTLEEILKILYKNIYGEDFKDDEVYKAISSDKELVRYYFNRRKIIKELSYYSFVVEENSEKVISFSEAEKRGMLQFYTCISKEIKNYEEGQELIKNASDNKYKTIIERDVFLDVLSNNDNDVQVYYVTLNGETISNTDESALKDELIKRGYGQYIISRLLPISYEEYKNNELYNSNDLWKIYRGSMIDIDQELLYYNELEEKEYRVYLPTVNDRIRPFDEFIKTK